MLPLAIMCAMQCNGGRGAIRSAALCCLLLSAWLIGNLTWSTLSHNALHSLCRTVAFCIQAAIEEKKRVLAEKAATLRRTLGRSKGDNLDPLDDSSLSRQAKVRPCRACY